MTLSAIAVGPGEHMIAMLRAEGLPTDDVQDAGRVLLQFDDDEIGAVVGYGGLERLGQHVLLRSVVVDAAQRGRGLGGSIVERLLVDAQSQGAHQAFALTSSKESWLEKLGFLRVSRADAPPAVLATRQARELCAATATLWRKDFA